MTTEVTRCHLTGAIVSVLPLPPSTNRYYRSVGAKVLISREGREYRSLVVAACMIGRVKIANGRLAVTIDFHPPDLRRRDVDNLQKPLLDAMQHGGLYSDDSQIDDLRIVRRGIVPGGMVRVKIQEIKP